MRAGIIAAGFGSRLRMASGPDTPKALTRISGRPLIDWVLADLELAAVEQVVVIVNEQSTSIRDHVERRAAARVQWIVETTPSSMHSFLRVLEVLARDGDPGPYLITTVDTIAPPGTYRRFIDDAAALPAADLILGLTTFVDDENPLRVDLEPGGPGVRSLVNGPYATAGYFLVTPGVLREAEVARARQLGALRAFLGHLLDSGYRMSGVRMPDSIDVDRPADVAAAEQLLKS